MHSRPENLLFGNVHKVRVIETVKSKKNAVSNAIRRINFSVSDDHITVKITHVATAPSRGSSLQRFLKATTAMPTLSINR